MPPCTGYFTLHNKWRHYRKQTILDAFDDLSSLYLLCVRIIEGYEELRSKARRAERETITKHKLDDTQRQVISDVSDRAVTEESTISLNNFYRPPLSSKWGISVAKKNFEDLGDVLSTFNQNFLRIDTE